MKECNHYKDEQDHLLAEMSGEDDSDLCAQLAAARGSQAELEQGAVTE